MRQRVALQEQLEKIAATVPGVIFSFRRRADGWLSIPWASAGFEGLYGTLPEDLRHDAMPALRHVHPDDGGRVRATIEESARTLEPWREEFRVLHPTLGELWVEGRSIAQRQPDGDVLWHGIMTDVTQRRRAEEQLRASERRFRALFEHMLDGYALCRMLWDERGRSADIVYLEVNASFFRLTGMRDVAGRRASELIPASLEENRDVLEAYGRVVRTGEPERIEQYFPFLDRHLDIGAAGRSDGSASSTPSSSNASPTEPPPSTPPIATSSPSATRCRTTCARRCASSTASPSPCWRTTAACCRRTAGASWKRSAGGAARMASIIDALLELSRLGRAPLRAQRVDMAALVAEVLDDLGGLRAGRDVRVHVGELPASNGDPHLLKRVWSNLLDNAFKYTSGKPVAEVEVGARQEGAEAVYDVRDDGAGFDMAGADRLFHVFQRLHPESEFPGTGFGLAIVQQIVQRHGGSVWAEAAVDQGATFFFTIGRAG